MSQAPTCFFFSLSVSAVSKDAYATAVHSGDMVGSSNASGLTSPNVLSLISNSGGSYATFW